MSLAYLSSWSTWTPLANHLWQSTIVVTVVWLVTFALKRNRRRRSVLALGCGLRKVSSSVFAPDRAR